MKTKPNICIDHPNVEPIITKTNPPHLGKLECRECGRYIRWVGRDEILAANFEVRIDEDEIRPTQLQLSFFE